MTRAPIDATTTPAWGELRQHLDTMQAAGMTLRESFEADPGRTDALSFRAGDLYVDLSKNLITRETPKLLVELATQVGLPERIEAMARGERINVTENRSVLHTALRRPATDHLVVDGVDVVAEVHNELRRISEFAEAVRTGRWLGASGKTVRHVVNIGIGGSDLGPAMVYQALHPYADAGIDARYISNVDPTDLAQALAGLNPETTLFVVASKTFTTLETLTNARMAREWLVENLRTRGIVSAGPDGARRAISSHFVAVSTALDKVAEFGIDPGNAFGFWDWVGGRYSVDSAVGLSLAIVLGPQVFHEFLAGFRALDEHFWTTPFERNVPVLMGMLAVWYVNFFEAATHAILPYSQNLSRFPAYLQQLTMESNGKSVRWDGSEVNISTGEVYWGEPGTNGQHAFFQLLHQGTRLVPSDFIAFVNPAFPLHDGGKDVHEVLLANYFAQTAALAFGKTADEVRMEGTPEHLVSAKVFSGNRPSTSIMAPALTPSVLGQLIALYEHITFVQGIVWGVDSFDQWGVELGKQLATRMAPAISGDPAALAGWDQSTRSLISYYHQNRR